MKPDYYTNAREHVMSYRVFKTMKVNDVSKIIGPIVEKVTPRKGKKARKAAQGETD
jgi:hypothetical protein